MNYLNPYYYTMPTNLVQPKIGLLGRLFGSTGVSIGNFLNGTQKVLNIANQTIPLVKQVRPLVGNAKTVFRVMNEFKKVNTPIKTNINSTQNNTNEELYIENTEKQEIKQNIEEGPVFFV